MAGVQFGFAAGEGSASTPETLLQSRRVSSSAGYRVSSLGFRSPLTSCCSISSGFSSSIFFFFLRSYLNGRVCLAFGSCYHKFELHREIKNHQREPSRSLMPAQPQHSALPAATLAPVPQFWPQSPLLLSDTEREGRCREQQGN